MINTWAFSSDEVKKNPSKYNIYTYWILKNPFNTTIFKAFFNETHFCLIECKFSYIIRQGKNLESSEKYSSVTKNRKQTKFQINSYRVICGEEKLAFKEIKCLHNILMESVNHRIARCMLIISHKGNNNDIDDVKSILHQHCQYFDVNDIDSRKETGHDRRHLNKLCIGWTLYLITTEGHLWKTYTLKQTTELKCFKVLIAQISKTW